MQVPPIPDGFHTVTPNMIVQGGEQAIEFYRQAFGAQVITPMTVMFFGSREGCVADPFGGTWTIATRKEIVPPEEMQRRLNASMV